MIKIIARLEKRGHIAHLTLGGLENDHWVGLITVMDKDWNTIKVRSELGDEFNSKKLFNDLFYSLLSNGYKLISIK
jgi:hypothetical protein